MFHLSKAYRHSSYQADRDGNSDDAPRRSIYIAKQPKTLYDEIRGGSAYCILQKALMWHYSCEQMLVKAMGQEILGIAAFLLYYIPHSLDSGSLQVL